MEIVFASKLSQDVRPWAEALQAALPDARVRLLGDGQPEGRADCAVVWTPPAELFVREPRLRYLFNLGAGVDALMEARGVPAHVQVVRLEDGGMAVQMAEYVLHYLLRASRAFDVYARQQAAGRWQAQAAIERARWTVGVMGAGLMGARVAQACAALEYPTAIWSRSGRGLPGVTPFAGESGFAAFLERTRVLVNVLPLTPETRAILCRQTFERLRPDAYVINIGRGGHLVEADLLAALEAGRLRGAALDVFAQEPLPKDHPFWRHPRICVTPHIAGATLMDEAIGQIAGKIQALAQGDAITGIVDRSRQY